MDRNNKDNDKDESRADSSNKSNFNHFKGKKPIKTIRGFVEQIYLDEIDQEIREDYGNFD